MSNERFAIRRRVQGYLNSVRQKAHEESRPGWIGPVDFLLALRVIVLFQVAGLFRLEVKQWPLQAVIAIAAFFVAWPLSRIRQPSKGVKYSIVAADTLLALAVSSPDDVSVFWLLPLIAAVELLGLVELTIIAALALAVNVALAQQYWAGFRWTALLPGHAFSYFGALAFQVLRKIGDEERVHASWREQEARLFLDVLHQAGKADVLTTYLEEMETRIARLIDPSATCGFEWIDGSTSFRDKLPSAVHSCAEEIFQHNRQKCSRPNTLCLAIPPTGRAYGMLWVTVGDGIKIQPGAELFLSVISSLAGSLIAEDNLRRSATRLPEIVSRTQELELGLSTILQRVTEQMGFDYASVSLVDEVREVIEMERTRNVPKGWRERSRFKLDSDDILAIVTRERQCVRNYGEWRPYFDPEIWRIYRQDLLARFWVPVVWNGKCVATISGGCDKERGLALMSDERMQEITILGEQYAELIGRWRPHCLLRELAEEAMRLVGAAGASAHIRQNGKLVLIAGGGKIDVDFLKEHQPRQNGLGALAESEGRAVAWSGAELAERNAKVFQAGIRSMAAVPLSIAPNVTGHLYVCHFRAGVGFSDSDLRLFQIFALQAQAVLRSGFLLRSLSESAESAFTAWEQQFIRKSASEVPLPRLLRRIRTILEAKELILWRYDPKERGANGHGLRLVESFESAIRPELVSIAAKLASSHKSRTERRDENSDLELWFQVQPDGTAEPNGVMYLRFGAARGELDEQETRTLINLGRTVSIRLAESAIGNLQSSRRVWEDGVRSLAGSNAVIRQSITEAIASMPQLRNGIFRYSPCNRVWLGHNPDGSFTAPLLEGADAESLADRLGLASTLAVTDHEAKALFRESASLGTSIQLSQMLADGIVVGAFRAALAIDANPMLVGYFRTLYGIANVNEEAALRLRNAHCLDLLSVSLSSGVDETTLIYRILTCITAREGLGLSRAFWITKRSDGAVSTLWVGGVDRKEAEEAWRFVDTELSKVDEDPLAWLLRRAGTQPAGKPIRLNATALSAVNQSLLDGTVRTVRSEDYDEWRVAIMDPSEKDVTYPFAIIPIKHESTIYGVIAVDNRYLWTQDRFDQALVPYLENLAEIGAVGFETEARRMELLRISEQENSSRSQNLQFEDRLVRLHRDLAHSLRLPLQLAEDELRFAIYDNDIPTGRRLSTPEVTLEKIRFAIGQLARAQHVVVWSRLLTQLEQPQLLIGSLQTTPFEEVRIMLDSAISDFGFVSRDKRFVTDKSVESILSLLDHTVHINAELFDECLRELLRNAQKYRARDSDVHVSCHLNRRKLTIIVRSTGVVLHKAERRFCLLREWRSLDAQSESSEGRGLGLWMVKQIMRTHGGAIVINSDDRGTSWFALRLPFRKR